jgi:hypothetical protein
MLCEFVFVCVVVTCICVYAGSGKIVKHVSSPEVANATSKKIGAKKQKLGHDQKISKKSKSSSSTSSESAPPSPGTFCFQIFVCSKPVFKM